MGIVDKYIDYANHMAQLEPEKGWEHIVLGFQANRLKTRFLPDKNISKGYQKLEDMMMHLVSGSVGHEGSYLWGNIFAPCEIFHSMGFRTLSIECLGCFLSGYHLEEFFIDYAQSLGIAPTLCSFHKAFVGAVASGVVPVPEFAVSTSLTCDGNLNTFRYLQKKTNVPFVLLDVPYRDDADSVIYLADQLRGMAERMERELGRTLDMDRLGETLVIENETREELKRFLKLGLKHYYPGRIIHQLYLMMGTHLMMGTREFLELIRFMNEEIETYPLFTGKKILWVHLLPYYQETLQAYFNHNERYQILASDVVLDSTEDLDASKPFESLARKLIHNVFNGSYRHKAEYISALVDEIAPDAVIHFNHWGCKQADGGSVILKEELKDRVPMLILDGDGIDHRNSHDGQIKTRLEAFLEMIEEARAC